MWWKKGVNLPLEVGFSFEAKRFVEKKRNMPISEANATTRCRIQPRGAEWLLIASEDLCYLSYVTPTHDCGIRPFLRSQGRSPHASGKAQNTIDPVGIPLLKGAPGNKPNPPKRVKAWGRCRLRPEELSSAEAHPAEPPEVRRPTKCDPTTREERSQMP